jgi:hypothetical protein
MSAADIKKAARQREIEALKNSLLAPGAKPPGGVIVVGNKMSDGKSEEENKFNKVMDWGTPRIVTNSKNRALVMD